MKRISTQLQCNTRNSILLKFKFLLLVVVFFTINFSFSQVISSYTFATNATSSLALDSNSNAIDMTTGTTSLIGASSDDTASAVTNFNLGVGAAFNFNFNSTNYSSFGVSDNGILTLGTTPGTTVYGLPNGTIPTIAAFANDMRVGTNGAVVAKIVGTSPNRTLVIQWTNNMIRYLGTAAAGTGTFQVRLYEMSNVIEFVYGAMTTNTSVPTNYYVGITSNTTATNLMTINTTTNTSNITTTPTANTYTASSIITALNSASNGSRRLYRFTPPVCTTPSAPTALNLTALTGGGSITGTFTAPGTAPTGYLVVRTTTSTPPSTPTSGTVYAPGSSALGGYVVSTNTATGLSDSGLSPSTTYWYWVYSYNAACSGGPLYSGALSGTQTTLGCSTATNTWTITGVGITGNWSTATNWSLGHAPYACEDAVIIWNGTSNSAQTTTITVDVPVTVKSLTISTIASFTRRYLLYVQQTVNNPITIFNDLTVSATGGNPANSETYFGSNGVVTVGGTASFGATGTNLASTGAFSATPTFYFKGDVTFGPNGLCYSGGTYYFDAPSAQTISMTTPTISLPAFQNVVIGNVNSPTVTVTGGSTYGLLVAGGNLTVNPNSVLNITSTNGVNQDTATTGVFSLGANSTLRLGGAAAPSNATNGLTTSNFPGGFTSLSLDPTSTVEYYGAAQSVYNVPTYGNLTISNAGTKDTNLGALTIAGNVLINASSTLRGRTFTHNIGGNWTNNGTFQRNNSTINFTKTTGIQTVDSGSSLFNNITHSGAGKLQLLGNDLTLDGNLVLNGGVVDARTNSKAVVVNNNATTAVAYTAGFIDGTLQRAVSATATSYLWPVGFTTNYTPAAYTFTDLTAGNLAVLSNSGDESSLGTSSLDSSKSVNAYWSLSGTLASTNYAGILTFPSTLNDDTSVVATYKIGTNNAGWAYPTVGGIPTTTSLTFTAASGLGTMAVATCRTPDASNAGTSQTICATSNAVLSANNPAVGTGTWSVVSGPSVLATQFSNVNAYNATFTPAGGAGTYKLKWSINFSAPASCSNAQTSTVDILVDPVSVGGSVTGGTTICSNATSGLLTLAGHTGTVIRWESAVSPFSTWTPIANTTTTYTSGVLTQTTKFRAVVQNGVCNEANSSDAQVSFQSTTWDGASWLNGLPNSATQVIFNGSYTPTSDAALVASASPLVLSACSVVIQSGVVTFPANYVLNVANTVDSTLGSLIFENGASLVQSNDVINPVGDYSGGNLGAITYRRTTTKVGLYDYTYWSTPVWPQLLTTMSPDSPNNYYFYFNPILANWVNVNSNNLMDVGKGYIIRAPYYADNTTGYTSNFSGVPNSGTITTPVQIGPTTATPIYREMNLIGNPYPSALSAISFLSNPLNTNVVDATMYFWTHNTPITSNVYNADDYAMFNYSGSVSSTPATATGNNNAAPNGYVASGQSFFIKGINSGGIATFQNNMRGTALSNGQFYRSSTPTTPTIENEIIDLERNRFWLDIFNTGGAFKQMMVGYIEQATNAFDRGFDGLTFNSGNVINFYSLVNPTTLLGIQGRALPFLTSDVVPLGYSTTINGTFQIQLSNYDAFFNTQNIYLKDKLLNSTHNLKLGNYTFETNAGTFNDRFEIVYENPLQTDTFNDTAVVVYKANDVLNIKATNKTISKVEVYDIRGRLLITKINCNASEIAIDLGTVNQVVLVQITTDDGIMVTKKYVN